MTSTRCPVCIDNDVGRERVCRQGKATAFNVKQQKAYCRAVLLSSRRAEGETPTEFEENVAALFEANGYSARVTPPASDGGIDVEARRGQDVLLIQCKRYEPENTVGVTTVRELVGVLATRPGTRGVLVTTSGFTRGAVEFASTSGV